MDFLQDPTVQLVLKLFHDYGYIALGAIAIPEGPLIMLIGGFLIKLGALEFWPTYISLIVGDFIADVWWYWVGYKLDRVQAIHRYHSRGFGTFNYQRIRDAFRRHQTLIMVGSKLTCGFGGVLAIPIIIAAGVFRIPFWKFLAIYGGAGFIWTLIPISAGYYFGEWYQSIESYIGRAAIICTFATFGLVCFYILWPLLGAAIGKKAIPEDKV